VQPAAGNAGTALGAVFLRLAHGVYGGPKRALVNDLCLGPSYTAEEIKQVLENCKLHFRYLLTTDELDRSRPSRSSTENRIVAWMQGRMEFGRARWATAASWRRRSIPIPPKT
jgi:carbamoyltransferase